MATSIIVSRQEAIAAGLKRYFTGQPCINGHLSERLVSSTNCMACAYARHARYYAENREDLCAKAREYRQTKDNSSRNLQRALNKATWSGERQNRERARKAATMKARRVKRRVETAGRTKPDHCDVCKRKAKKICFDHCHKTGKFRGWLCEGCNFSIGHADDSAQRLMELAQYLLAHENQMDLAEAQPPATNGNGSEAGAEAQA